MKERPVEVDISIILAGYDAEIARLTRRVIVAEAQVAQLRAQQQSAESSADD